jgi:hypothetical protein
MRPSLRLGGAEAQAELRRRAAALSVRRRFIM